jgi:hypothetical protein
MHFLEDSVMPTSAIACDREHLVHGHSPETTPPPRNPNIVVDHYVVGQLSTFSPLCRCDSLGQGSRRRLCGILFFLPGVLKEMEGTGGGK